MCGPVMASCRRLKGIWYLRLHGRLSSNEVVESSSKLTTPRVLATFTAPSFGVAEAEQNASVLNWCKRFYHNTHGPSAAADGENSGKTKSKGTQNASRDTRLAGRRRFYKSVGITSVSPPWERFGDVQDDGDVSSLPLVDSPISAGVDGTQSGSGITIHKPTKKAMVQMLRPRLPGSTIFSASLSPEEDSSTKWYGVTLDQRPIRTPLGQPLAVPSSLLALAIASEWDAQKLTIQPVQMPLMTLVCTTLDQIVSQRELTIQHCLRYLNNDTTCYYADPMEDRVLYRKQSKYWNALHKWAAHKSNLGSTPAKAVGAGEGLLMSRARLDKDKRSGLPHPDEVVQNAERWIRTLDAWHLMALQTVCTEAKSFLVGMAVLSGLPLHDDDMDNDNDNESNHDDDSAPKSPFAHDTSNAVMAARVEEEFQIENWGLVEGGHDYDRLNCSVQMHAAKFLISSIAVDNHFKMSDDEVGNDAPDDESQAC